MALVTLEGTSTPSTYLARGARKTVERTGYVNKLIRGGYVRVVQEHRAMEEVLTTAAQQYEAAVLERQITTAPTAVDPKPVWADFLERQHISYPKKATRADMIARWEAASGTTVDAGSDAGPDSDG